VRILGISGSLRSGSYNTALLQAAGELVPANFELMLYRGLREVPPYDDPQSPPPAVRRLRDEIATSDAILIATPEYNSSIPGQLKNALDWMSRPLATSPLRHKPAAVVGASTGVFGAVWAQAELRKVLAAIGARVIDREVPVPTADEIVRDRAKLESTGTHSLIVGLLAELLAEARPAAAPALVA
jgi:chromate reductase